jgi:hypothetical protein
MRDLFGRERCQRCGHPQNRHHGKSLLMGPEGCSAERTRLKKDDLPGPCECTGFLDTVPSPPPQVHYVYQYAAPNIHVPVQPPPNRCPRCSSQITWVGSYNRWYCQNERQYI